MNDHHFYANGRVTNYEMTLLRELKKDGDTRWIVPWSSVALRFHPQNLEDWIAHSERYEHD